jgi:hypothetical protein
MVCEVLASWKAKTRLRPCSLAVKQALSASLITADRLGVRRLMATTPILTPTWKALSFHSKRQACTASRSCVAALMAKSAPQFSSSTANSSPPMRARRSSARRLACRTGERRRSSSSPARWPKESLMRWK